MRQDYYQINLTLYFKGTNQKQEYAKGWEAEGKGMFKLFLIFLGCFSIEIFNITLLKSVMHEITL